MVAPRPVHHPTDEFLLDYAAGALGEPKSLLVATHLSMCPACRGGAAPSPLRG